MFRFSPLSDEQINDLKNAEQGLLPPGNYPFIVKEAINQTSSKGNAMIKLVLGIKGKDGENHFITDYLVDTEKMAFKLKHFCEAIGLADKYVYGSFAISDLIQRRGELILGIQKGNAKPDGSGHYSDKNSVKDYIVPAHVKAKKTVEKNDFISDDVPF